VRDVETIIVGGGPAGSSCARELTKNGRECLILERQRLPKFKLCAGWITPKVLRDLEIGAGAYPYGITQLKAMRVCFGLTPWSLTVPANQYSVRRIEFDNWLLRRCGAEIVPHPVRVIVRDGGRYVVDGAFRCEYLIGAGGTNCPVRRSFFEVDRGRLIVTQEIEYETKVRDGVCTLFYPFEGFAGYGWCVPKADGVNIGYGGVASQFRRNVKSYWGTFVRAVIKRGLIDAEPPAPSSHPYRTGDRRKSVRSGNAFIVGDAAGLATLDMGEGIGPAVESGLLAAREILGLDRYTIDKIAKYTLDGLPGKLMGGFVGSCSS
jgi:flavin-dependent dehydrogenase